MDNANYTTLNRQSGLLRDMQTVAQNIANMATTGYRAESVIFSEFVADLGPNDPSLSMANTTARSSNLTQGALTLTNGTFDVAIEGDGFFMVATPDGERLTRAGVFTPSGDGNLVAPDGALLLDAGGAPIFVPPDAQNISIASDGTMSADGNPLAQIGLWTADPLQMTRAEGVRFDPGGPPTAIEDGKILQGFIESSNVDAIVEVARMIEVQRAYELGQTFLDREDERVRTAIRTIGQ